MGKPLPLMCEPSPPPRGHFYPYICNPGLRSRTVTGLLGRPKTKREDPRNPPALDPALTTHPRAPGGGAGPALPLRTLSADTQRRAGPENITDKVGSPARGPVVEEPREVAAESGPRVGESDMVTEEGDVVGTEGLTFELAAQASQSCGNPLSGPDDSR
ncbi:hypothetical protein MJG53_017071 [Ovis ammon polii x Ovis aries]|uniref:Uncharacterized protein n=2 Tax=Ovis TaxID=9935 RepID=A0A836CRY7_SHEEP|nr:hypothetical protein JEQ12_011376 [Ovis aries]KAI4562017.1 hypothetical protein MJG53_017071 [Ovis ammon polii x Ovis aries]